MEQKPSSNIPPIRMIKPRPRLNYFIGPRGLIFILLGLLVLFIGGVGYLEYDRLVKPYLPIYICCVPAIILAGLLIFFGIASKFTTIRQVQIQRPNRNRIQDDQIIDLTKPGAEFRQESNKGRGDDVFKYDIGQQNTVKSPERGTNFGDISSNQNRGPPIRQQRQSGMRKFEPQSTSKEDLLAQKRNLDQFLKNLDEQHDEGLLMDNVYSNLKIKYKNELNDINSRLTSMGGKKVKRTKLKKKE